MWAVILVWNVGSYRAALQGVFDGRMNIRKEMMELEVSERILVLKIHKKELTLSRLSQLVDDADHCRVLYSTLCSSSCSSSSSSSCCCSSSSSCSSSNISCMRESLYSRFTRKNLHCVGSGAVRIGHTLFPDRS